MAEEMLKYYNTLTAEQQKEAFDFIIFLCEKNGFKADVAKPEKKEEPVMGLYGMMSESEAAELRAEIDWESMKAPSERGKNPVEFVRGLRDNDRI